MDEKTLLECAQRAMEQMGFQPSPNEKPWLVKMSEKKSVNGGRVEFVEYRELKQKGFSSKNNGQPATFQVIDKNYHNRTDFYWQQELGSQFNKLASGSCVRLPQFWDLYAEDLSNNSFAAFLWERPVGKSILSQEEFVSPLFLGTNKELENKVLEVSQIITDTEKTLFRLTEADATNYFPKISVAEYFIERFSKWMKRVRDEGEGNGCLIRKDEILPILERVFYKASGLTMAPSFNLFGNTDIVKSVVDGKYFLVNGRFESKPFGFLKAAWLWNLVMHGYKKTPEQSRDDFREVYSIFYRVDGVSNILERLFAASYIDARYWLSPFDELGTEERENGRNNLYLALKEWGRF